jgi:hypothetical protein
MRTSANPGSTKFILKRYEGRRLETPLVLPAPQATTLNPIFVLLAVGHGGPFEGASCGQLLHSPSCGLAQVSISEVGIGEVCIGKVGIL